MVIKIHHVYGGHNDVIKGEPQQVREQLHKLFPFLGRYEHETLHEDLVKLSNQQSLIVTVE